VEPQASGSAGVTWAWIFLTVAVVLVAVGFFVMFTYHGEHGQLVGGDAYNLIIIATRGVGFMAAGVVSALLGIGCLLTAIHWRVSDLVAQTGDSIPPA
jgi:uncharacterized membrane protein YhiD involved in acid resistance